MSERRYSDDEVSEIFERATKASLPSSRPAEGLTLRELQEVGKEVGLAPELVERAAKSLDRKGHTHDRLVVGLPVGVGRTIELEHPLTDAEWHRLVVDLRETFEAQGKLSEHGPFKQWTNGNLQALLEPTPDGQRLRLKTFKADAMRLMSTGLGMTGITAGILTILYLRAVPFDATAPWIVFTTGIGLLVAGALRVPGWARLRRRQMEEIAERLTLATALPPPEMSDEAAD